MYGKAAAEVGVPTREIAQLLAVFACNNHTICNSELQPLGPALTQDDLLSCMLCLQADLTAQIHAIELGCSYVKMCSGGDP